MGLACWVTGGYEGRGYSETFEIGDGEGVELSGSWVGLILNGRSAVERGELSGDVCMYEYLISYHGWKSGKGKERQLLHLAV